MYSTCLLIFTFFCASQVQCQTKEACDLEDVKCVTEGAQSVYQDIVSGVPAIGLETSDPMYLDFIEAHLPTLNYTLSDSYWHGMKDCKVEKLQMVFKDMSWYLYLICPLLILESHYYVHGTVATLYTDGEGKCKLSHDNYHLGIRANMESYTDAEDKDHVNLTKFVLDVLEVRGFVNYRFNNFYYGNTEKSKAVHKYMNDHWKEMIVYTQEPAMYVIIGKLIENINMYLKSKSINELFYKKV